MIVSQEKHHGKDKKGMLYYIIGFFVGVFSALAGVFLFDKRKSTNSFGDIDKDIERNRELAESNHSRAESTAQSALNTISEIREKQKVVENNSGNNFVYSNRKCIHYSNNREGK